jgi:late competence protein required for DNA uptake (superfamily II DNA/RNA helicase)
MKLKSNKALNRLLMKKAKRAKEKENHMEANSAVSEKTTICICPKCGITHESYMRWAGRGEPRIYCRNCRPFIDSIA